MHPSVVPLAAQFRLNTALLANCVAGLTEAQAAERITRDCNSPAFLVAHLVESRHLLAATLGAPLKSDLPPALARARSQDEAGPLPPLAALTRAWERIAAHLAVTVERLDTPALAAAAAGFPGSDGTLLGALAFLAQHESYHVGQLGLLRRQLGLPAMRYILPPREPGRRGA